jgi:hypothetical protein
MRMISNSILILLTIMYCHAISAAPPVFDAHSHYNHDVWKGIPPEDAIRRLREAGVTRAIISSASDTGTRRLYKLAPDMIVPMLSPYLTRGTNDYWLELDYVLPYLKKQIATGKYLGIGEIHIYEDDAELPLVEAIVELAREHNLMLQVHAEARIIERLYDFDPEAKIIWAHAGFNDPSTVRELLDKFPALWPDLSIRKDIFVAKDGFTEEWRQLLIDYSDRFMIGIDTYTGQRWLKANAIMARMLAVLNQLPKDTAEKIRYKNGQRLVKKYFD